MSSTNTIRKLDRMIKRYKKPYTPPVKKRDVAKIVKRTMYNGSIAEQKRDRYSVNTTVSTTPSIVLINSANTNGDDVIGQRIGDLLKLVSYSIKGHMSLADPFNYVRLIFFTWSNNSSTSPVSADIFDDTSTAQALLYGQLKQQSRSGRDVARVRVLHDRVYKMDTYRPTCQVNVSKTFKRPINMYFDAGLSTGTNLLYYCIVSDSSLVTHPSFQFYAQLKYSDL